MGPKRPEDPPLAGSSPPARKPTAATVAAMPPGVNRNTVTRTPPAGVTQSRGSQPSSPPARSARRSPTQPGFGGVAALTNPRAAHMGSPADNSMIPEVPDVGATAILPPSQQRFGRPPEPRSESGRKKGDSRQPLEFAEAQQIGRFGLIREIARGGMGQVFLARDTKLGRKVAIKFLLHPDPNFVSRFVIEARATARCTHENIVTIFEVGEHAGLPFMVLEYLEGKTLSQLLEGRMPVRAFVELMIPVVRALERAHEHGIVHRDLKPSNIFVTDRGHVKVLDFGVAKAMGSSSNELDKIAAPVAETRMMDAVEPEVTYVTFSGGGSLVGTLPYMSPEQWGADTVDHASDIWAVGIMFWRALAGVHPAGTMTPDKLKARLTDLDTPLPSIATRDPSVPRDVVAIIDRCLAKRKADRYPSATELLADLQAFIQPRSAIGEECPYRGLAAFGEGDAKYFFGRTNEIRTALGQLETWPLLAVIGPSGVGKSSFVHAGLVPAVRRTGGDWQIRVLRPGRSPLASLGSVLGDDPSRSLEYATPQILAQLTEAPGVFGEALRREAARNRQRILIVVDQLEELFTLSEDDTTRRTFLAALLAAADDPSAPVRVVLSMRADFLDRLAGHKQFLTELSRGLFFLSAPDFDSLRETIVRPAELAGYAFENPDIVDDMLQMATSRGALPLLQFAATRLWDGRDRTRRLLTVAAYNSMGGVGGAFARHADEVAAAVPLHQQALLRAVMSRLVTPEGTRAVIDHNELLSLSTDSSDVQQIIDKLVAARLVQLHTDPTQGATVEIVHEVLITEWPTLKRWLEDSHALRGFTHELQIAARQWSSRGRPADLVWRGATAQEALSVTSKHVLDLSSMERDFLAAVKKQMTRGRRRQVFAFTAIFVVLGAVIAGGAVAVIRISQAEKVATERLIAADKEANRARDAEAKIKEQLDTVTRAQADKIAAETTAEEKKRIAEEAEKALGDSKEELQRKNVELLKRESEARAAQIRAEKAAKDAAASAEAAKRATEEAKVANQKLKVQLDAEKARADKAEREKKAISTGSLKEKL
ncbi:MAG: protein kinase domain-containing protein [Kofleriaceae bacterium]